MLFVFYQAYELLYQCIDSSAAYAQFCTLYLWLILECVTRSLTFEACVRKASFESIDPSLPITPINEFPLLVKKNNEGIIKL